MATMLGGHAAKSLDGTLQGLDSETVTLTSLLPECPTAELIYQHLWAAWHPLCRQHSPLCIPMTSRLGTALATHAGASCAGRPTTGNFATEWVLGQLTAGVVTAAGAQLYERHSTITRCVTAALFYGLVTHGDAGRRPTDCQGDCGRGKDRQSPTGAGSSCCVPSPGQQPGTATPVRAKLGVP